MTKAVKYVDWSEKVGYRVWGHFTKFGDGDNWHGVVVTPFGFVDVRIWERHDKDPGTTYLSFIYQDRKYSRSYKRQLSQRGAITKAARFAREIWRRR